MTSLINFQSVFHALPNAYMVVDPDLNILDANRACLNNVAMTRDEVVGQSLANFFRQRATVASMTRLWESYDEALATKAQVVLPLLHYATERPDGDLKPADDRYWTITHVPVLDVDGTVTCIVSHAVEIGGNQTTELKDAPHTASDSTSTGMSNFGANPGWLPPHRETNGRLAAASPNLRVLLVEDNEDLKETTAALIEALGHRVVAVDNAERALDLLGTESFDVLFTDLSLPKTTGAELAREALQRYPTMRVIITSGYGRAMANARNLDAVFLPKPYQLMDIQVALDGTNQLNV